MIEVPAWLPILTIALACALGLALGWAGIERWKRNRITRQRNDAIRDAARLRDQLGQSRRMNDPRRREHDLVALRMEERLGLVVQRPPDLIVPIPPA